MESLSQVAPILVGLGGLASAFFSSYKSLQAEKSSSRARADAKMVENFQDLYDEQQKKIAELNEEMKRIKLDQSEERRQWAEERIHFQARIDSLVEQNTMKDTKIAELSGMIKILQQKSK